MLYKVASSEGYTPASELYKFISPAAAGNYDASLINGTTSAGRSARAMLYPLIKDSLLTKAYGFLGGTAGAAVGHPMAGTALAYLAAKYLVYNNIYNMAKANRLNIDASMKESIPQTIFDQIYKWFNKERLAKLELSKMLSSRDVLKLRS